MSVIRHVAVQPLTDAQRADHERLKAKSAAEDADTLARFGCPRCGVEPGEECRWRARHSRGQMHAPRLSRAYRARRREESPRDS